MVAVTGATGFVGRVVVQALRNEGFAVRALARDAAKAYDALPSAGDGTEIIVGDVFSKDTRQRLMHGASAAAHLIGIRVERAGGVTFERLHVDATRAVVESAVAAGASRFVHMSALGTRPDAPSAYHRTKFDAEQIVRDSGLAWTILRPSLILGAGGEFMEMAHGWVTGQAPPKRFLPYFTPTLPLDVDPQSVSKPANSGVVQPMHVDDVAAAVVKCLKRDRTIGEVYPLGGDSPITWPDLLVAIRDTTPDANSALKPRGVSAAFAIHVARMARRLGLSNRLPFSEDDVLLACEDNSCAIDKAQADGVIGEPLLAGAIARSVAGAL